MFDNRTDINAVRRRSAQLRAETARLRAGNGRRAAQGARPGDKHWARIDSALAGARLQLEDADPLSVRSLTNRGWTEDRGWLYAPVEGTFVAMYPADIGRDPELAAVAKDARQSLTPNLAPALNAFLGFLAKGHPQRTAMAMLEQPLKNALSESIDTSGGFIAPAEFSATILARVQALAIVRPRATVKPTSRDTLTYARFRENTTSGSLFSSDFAGGWVGEAPGQSIVDPALGQLDIPVKKLRVPAKLSRDLVDDSDILAGLADDAGRNFAVLEDKAFLTGLGMLDPLGILNSGVTTVDVEGTTVDTISNTTAAAGSAPKLLTFAAALPSQYQRDAVLVMRASTEGSVGKLVDAQGRFHHPRTLGPDGYRQALGYTLRNSDLLDAEGTNASKVLLVGDFSQYIIAQRQLFSIQVLPERFADNDQTGLIISERVGGAPAHADAWRVGIV